jgi:hypothetical protein
MLELLLRAFSSLCLLRPVSARTRSSDSVRRTRPTLESGIAGIAGDFWAPHWDVCGRKGTQKKGKKQNTMATSYIPGKSDIVSGV